MGDLLLDVREDMDKSLQGIKKTETFNICFVLTEVF